MPLKPKKNYTLSGVNIEIDGYKKNFISHTLHYKQYLYKYNVFV